jgi:hypothetical protein
VTSKNTSTSVSGKRDKNESRENLTMMILVSSSLYAASRLFAIIDIMSTQIYQFMGITAPMFRSYYVVINFCVTLGYFGTNFFTYLAFKIVF